MISKLKMQWFYTLPTDRPAERMRKMRANVTW